MLIKKNKKTQISSVKMAAKARAGGVRQLASPEQAFTLAGRRHSMHTSLPFILENSIIKI